MIRQCREWLAAVWQGPQMRRRDAERWYAARTLADLGELTAQWLEGDLASQPGYAANCGPDDETGHLVPVLAAANRAGYLTNSSQPGVPDEIGYDDATWCQRAGVTGFAEPVLAQRIHDVCTAAGLTVHLYSPAVRRGGRHGSTVTTRAGQPVTGFGRRLPRRLIRFLYEDCHQDAVADILAAHQVTVVDPVWGRDNVLWPVLAEATR